VRIPLSRLFGAIVLLGAVAGGASACASKDGGSPPPATVAAGPCAIAVTTDVNTKPAITVPACATKPDRTVFTRIVPGTGPAAKPGDSVVVRYYGASFSNHKQFDASWDRGKSETFTVAPLGQAGVIPGWNTGLVGAKAGERRLLVIPPAEGYGAQGSPPNIGPNETLIFVVDIVSVSPGS
jgi:peptidylprolyl isomerase